MRTKTIGSKGFFCLFLAVLALTACEGLLDVSDPQRYTADDVQGAPEAVANGVEGAVHQFVDGWVIYQALLSDVYQHTGTWNGYDETDHGRFDYSNSPYSGAQNQLLRAQWFAGAAEELIKNYFIDNNLGGESAASQSPLTAQVQMAGGIADLLNGMTFCEAVGEASGVQFSDLQMLAQAENKLTAAMATAQSAGRQDYFHTSQAARAVSRQLQGNLAGAAADAAATPAGFVYHAVFNVQSTNSVVQLTTKEYNEAAGLMYKWWPMIEESNEPGFMRDPHSGKPDMRLPVYFDGEVATDNETPHYSQWKYSDQADDIPMFHYEHMQLIIAESMAAGGDFAGATGVLNGLRGAVNLPPIDVPTTNEQMMDYLLWERFAELFMEGYRMVDLHRFNLVAQVFNDLGDSARPGGGRPTKWPMSGTEALYNTNLDHDPLKRCLPRA